MIRNRIKELRHILASDLRANPRNYRKHPPRQKALLKQLLSEVGYADALIAYESQGQLILIDGHLRAETTPDQTVPVLVLDVTEQEAKKLLLTLDPLAAMAETDAAILGDLLRVTETSGEVDAWLKERAEASALFDVEVGAFPDLPSGDKAPFQSMTFTLSDGQAEVVKRALGQAKGGDFTGSDNANSNGNALFAIAEAYLG